MNLRTFQAAEHFQYPNENRCSKKNQYSHTLLSFFNTSVLFMKSENKFNIEF